MRYINSRFTYLLTYSLTKPLRVHTFSWVPYKCDLKTVQQLVLSIFTKCRLQHTTTVRINSGISRPTPAWRLFSFRLAVATRSDRRADDRRCWRHVSNIIIVAAVNCENGRKNCRCKSVFDYFDFWFAMPTNNYKRARPPLGGHWEVRTIEEIACRHTGPTVYYIQ